MHEKPTPGSRWRHYKSLGGDDYTYEVLGMAYHSETQEDMVIYKMLYDSHAELEKAPYKKGTVFVRPLALWYDVVEYKGQQIQRFTEI